MNKIEAARQEYADWCQAIGIDTIEKLNETLLEGPPTRYSGTAADVR